MKSAPEPPPAPSFFATIPGAIIAASLIISAAILYGTGAFSNLKPEAAKSPANNTAPTVKSAAAQPSTQPTTQPSAAGSGKIKVSQDDDAVLGSSNAPVTLIEFSDYQCPYCQQSYKQLMPTLRRDYIDTGKVKFVYRDFPLKFHNNAQTYAEAAECARDQGGNTAYYQYEAALFGAANLSPDQLPTLASDIGLDSASLQSCLDSRKFQSEVEKDTTDGTAAGVSGTPTFFVGRSSSSGTIDAVKIVGNQSVDTFKNAIDQLLPQ